MRVLDFLRSTKRASPGQFALFRLGFGLWLASRFAALTPWAGELFSSAGVLPDAAASPVHGVLPSPFAWIDAPWFAVLWCLLGAVLALLLAAGWRRLPVALALWYVWAALLDRNPLIAYPETPYTGFLLLLVALVPDGEPARWRGRPVAPADWRMPAGVFLAAWALLALGYAHDAFAKLRDPAWLEGRALGEWLQGPLARPGPALEALVSAPGWTQAVVGWALLAAELAFLPLCFTRRGRAWAWCTLGLLQALMLLVADTSVATLGVLWLHAFAFDPDWLPARTRIGRRPVLFFDGECGLCQALVRFVMREDDGAVLQFAPLQGRVGQAVLKRFELPAQDFDSLLYLPDLDGGRPRLRTRGVIGALDLLGGIWRIGAWALWLVPWFVRDLGYQLVARTRYRLFGPYRPSPLPEPRWEERFLT